MHSSLVNLDLNWYTRTGSCITIKTHFYANATWFSEKSFLVLVEISMIKLNNKWTMDPDPP